MWWGRICWSLFWGYARAREAQVICCPGAGTDGGWGRRGGRLWLVFSFRCAFAQDGPRSSSA
eukprot:8869549-Alexandrium_andersonii.AAC.1